MAVGLFGVKGSWGLRKVHIVCGDFLEKKSAYYFFVRRTPAKVCNDLERPPGGNGRWPLNGSSCSLNIKTIEINMCLNVFIRQSNSISDSYLSSSFPNESQTTCMEFWVTS